MPTDISMAEILYDGINNTLYNIYINTDITDEECLLIMSRLRDRLAELSEQVNERANYASTPPAVKGDRK